MQILSWVFGIGAMAALFMLYQQTERKRLLGCKLCADVCWVVHYFCLGAYGGMVPNFVGIFRELVFVRRDKARWAGGIWVPIFFILLNWGIGISTFQRPINIIPIAASTLVTISLWLRRPDLTKLLSVPVSLAFLTYDILVASYIGVVNESIALASILLSYIKEKKGTK